jgi:predicted Zn finger-like uncharacterized protein
MSQLTTGCPNCATNFRLTPEQLEMADGLVRCGKCMTVFNASENAIAAQQEISEKSEDNTQLPVMTELLHNEFGHKQAPIKERKPSPLPAQLTVILVGAILLATQYSYFFSRELGQTEAYRTALISFCHYTGCKMEFFRDIDKLAVKQFVVHSHPSQPGALTVDLIIENRGLFDQPFPKIALRFADMQNQPVAERVFTASQYLYQGTQPLKIEPKLIPSGKQRRVKFSLVDPGDSAINYSVELKK